MPSLEDFTTEKLTKFAEKGLSRQLYEDIRHDGVHVTHDGKPYISFTCNDTFGLTHHPEVKQAAIQATKEFGTGSGASRLVTGNHPLYTTLENTLAALKNTESALVFGSGYLANLGVISSLMTKGDLIIADKYIHACMLDGARLSGASLLRFQHNDLSHCVDLLKKHRKNYKKCLILTETIVSMDGDKAPLNDLLTIADDHDCWLLSDDAHGLGMLEKPRPHPNHIQVGTLSKAAGCYGGYVCASKSVTNYFINTARSLIFTTALPPSVLASAQKALEIIQNNDDLAKKALSNAQLFTTLAGLPIAQSTIVPLILGDEEKALKASGFLKNSGFLVSAIRPPTVPKGTARLRFTFSALHDEKYIQRLADTVALLQEQI